MGKGTSSSSSSSMVLVKTAIALFIIIALSFQGCSAATTGFGFLGSKTKSADNTVGHSTVFPVNGNVYPLGFYSVSIRIGTKVFDLDIDTGSDLTWVQCDAPCTGCTKPIHLLYKPGNNVVTCSNVLCASIHADGKVNCPDPKEQCDYEVEYADQGSSLGVLVTDNFPLRLINGTWLSPRLGFGCGYDQKNPGPTAPPTAGVLGLGNGKASIVSQLQRMGLLQNVIGHCFSGQGGGYLFIGNSLVPSSGVSWTPMLRLTSDKHYNAGPAELIFGGKSTGLKGLQLIFDSGSSYTYFNSVVYKSTLDSIKKDLNGKLKDAPEEKALSVCWKGTKPFKSLNDVKGHFKTLALGFTKSKNGQLEVPPENYLIITKNGNVCLGILNGSEVGLGSFNVIGGKDAVSLLHIANRDRDYDDLTDCFFVLILADIFMQDKLVIYDNEQERIGWIPSNCKKLQKS
ncbi:Aspartic proteinase Asp1 [Linum perenne]